VSTPRVPPALADRRRTERDAIIARNFIESIDVESKVDHERIVERFKRISQLFQIEIVDGVHRRSHISVLSTKGALV
jgi:hypothetical protein